MFYINTKNINIKCIYGIVGAITSQLQRYELGIGETAYSTGTVENFSEEC